MQRPGQADGASGGDPEHIPALVRAAVAAGCDGLFLETHPEPSRAPSDATNMLPLAELPERIEELPEEGVLNVKRLKDTLGTSRLSARRVFENVMQWDATHSLVQTTNYLPRVAQVDHGTWRRLALVRFPYTFTATPAGPHERLEDSGLKARLEQGKEGQYEAVLAWLVEGATTGTHRSPVKGASIEFRQHLFHR